MFRALRQCVSAVRPERLAVALLACLFLLSVDGLIPPPVEAGSSTSQMAATRRSQNRAANTMRRTDSKIKSLKRAKTKSRASARKAAKRLRNVQRRQKHIHKRLLVATDRLEQAAIHRDRTLRVHPNPTGAQIADRPKLRQRVRKLEAKANAIDRSVKRLRRKERRNLRVMKTRAKAVARIKQKVESKTAKRERSEQTLGAAIKRMVALAQVRSATHTTARPGKTGFRRPARGHISQRYGRSHDGIDIATARGAAVHASATGYVAFVGWNPWDEGKRAYVVIIGHAGGYETIYGHLLPIRKVRPGQFVRKGQTIGRAGSTGHSTGPHVHWEVSRGFRTLNPTSVGR
jgi:murein DD-endopeptidase MepM/ murein hydrolase activator NlpD